MIKTQNIKLLIALLLITTISFIGCYNYSDISSEDMQQNYDENSPFQSLESKIFHKNDSLSVLVLRFKNEDLQYAVSEESGKYQAKWSIHIKLFDAFETKKMLDSISFNFVDSINHQVEFFRTQTLSFPLQKGKKYGLSLSISDLNKKNEAKRLLVIDKEDAFSAANFRLYDSKHNMQLSPIIQQKQEYRIVYVGQAKELYVSVFHQNFPIAKSPFSEEKDQPLYLKKDSSFILPIENASTPYFSVNKTGIYHFRTDTTQNKGFTLFVYYPNFPNVVLPEHMLFPLRYITTAKEFNQILLQKDKRQAVEEFWLEKSGNKERARKMITAYYSRVVLANDYFTSYQEGWKTDRGMIFIVFGKPNIVYKTTEIEKWIYGEERNIRSLSLSFTRMDNPFTNNDFKLVRSPSYKDAWYRSVEVWRR